MSTTAKKSTKKSTKAGAKPKEQVPEHDGMRILGDADQRIIGKFTVGRDLLVMRVSSWKGKKSLDIRRFYDNGKEEWAPSPKGVSVPSESLAEFMDALSANSGELNSLMEG